MIRTWPVRGSKRATLPLASAAQTLPAPTATPVWEPPTGTERDTRLVWGSTSTRLPVSAPVTQTPPSPAARPVGVLPSGMVATTRPLPASILESVLSVTFATHTDP